MSAAPADQTTGALPGSEFPLGAESVVLGEPASLAEYPNNSGPNETVPPNARA